MIKLCNFVFRLLLIYFFNVFYVFRLLAIQIYNFLHVFFSTCLSKHFFFFTVEVFEQLFLSRRAGRQGAAAVGPDKRYAEYRVNCPTLFEFVSNFFRVWRSMVRYQRERSCDVLMDQMIDGYRRQGKGSGGVYRSMPISKTDNVDLRNFKLASVRISARARNHLNERLSDMRKLEARFGHFPLLAEDLEKINDDPLLKAVGFNNKYILKSIVTFKRYKDIDEGDPEVFIEYLSYLFQRLRKFDYENEYKVFMQARQVRDREYSGLSMLKFVSDYFFSDFATFKSFFRTGVFTPYAYFRLRAYFILFFFLEIFLFFKYKLYVRLLLWRVGYWLPYFFSILYVVVLSFIWILVDFLIKFVLSQVCFFKFLANSIVSFFRAGSGRIMPAVPNSSSSFLHFCYQNLGSSARILWVYSTFDMYSVLAPVYYACTGGLRAGFLSVFIVARCKLCSGVLPSKIMFNFSKYIFYLSKFMHIIRQLTRLVFPILFVALNAYLFYRALYFFFWLQTFDYPMDTFPRPYIPFRNVYGFKFENNGQVLYLDFFNCCVSYIAQCSWLDAYFGTYFRVFIRDYLLLLTLRLAYLIFKTFFLVLSFCLGQFQLLLSIFCFFFILVMKWYITIQFNIAVLLSALIFHLLARSGEFYTFWALQHWTFEEMLRRHRRGMVRLFYLYSGCFLFLIVHRLYFLGWVGFYEEWADMAASGHYTTILFFPFFVVLEGLRQAVLGLFILEPWSFFLTLPFRMLDTESHFYFYFVVLSVLTAIYVHVVYVDEVTVAESEFEQRIFSRVRGGSYRVHEFWLSSSWFWALRFSLFLPLELFAVASAAFYFLYICLLFFTIASARCFMILLGDLLFVCFSAFYPVEVRLSVRRYFTAKYSYPVLYAWRLWRTRRYIKRLWSFEYSRCCLNFFRKKFRQGMQRAKRCLLAFFKFFVFRAPFLIVGLFFVFPIFFFLIFVRSLLITFSRAGTVLLFVSDFWANLKFSLARGLLSKDLSGVFLKIFKVCVYLTLCVFLFIIITGVSGE